MTLSNGYDGWSALINQHIERYPAMAARDVYKLLFQGIMGPEQSLPSAEAFTSRLQGELDSLKPDASEPLLESVRPDGKLRRIYLRSWLVGEQKLPDLVQACLETSQRTWGKKQELRRIWGWFLDQVEEHHFPTILLSEARSLDRWLNEDDFPAPHHHSQAYEAAYHPAYRLIGTELAGAGYLNERV